MEQHNAHCRLMKGGHAWFIRRVTPDGFVFMRRPLPGRDLPAYETVDTRRLDWDRYCAVAAWVLTYKSTTG